MEGVGGSRRRIIRPFRFPDDYPAVLDLWEHAGSGVHVGRSDTLEEISKKVQRDPDLFLVAESTIPSAEAERCSVPSRKLIGSVIGGFDGRRGMVYHLAVAEEYRQQGIGTALMEEVERRLKAKGCLKYYLLVVSGNEQIIQFYARLGWQAMDVTIMGKEL